MKQASGTSSEVELAIGEANQLYPEIWRHLDEAQRELVDRDTRQYDILRSTVLAEMGITDIQTASTDWYTKYGTYAGTTHQKIVRFDYQGYERARAACKALMAAMPEVDWDALAREDVRAIAEAGSLQSAKYKTIVRVVAALAALAIVTFGVWYVVSSGSSDGVSDEEAAAMRARAEAREAEAKARSETVNANRARIDELRVSVKARCLPAEISELAKLLREEGQTTDAKKLEAAPCVPARPTCKPIPGPLLDRLAAQYESVLAAPASVRCDGMLAPGSPPVPALSVWFEDRGALVRGVVSADAKTDLVPFAPGPGKIIVGYGDLDDDGGDEAVFATDADIWVGKIVNGAYVDTKGPRSAKKCQEEVNIERDLRPDKKGSTYRLVITTLDKKGCEGDRVFYRLRDGKLVEEE